MDVHGTVAEGFEPVRDAFARNFAALGDRGAAVAVYRDGRKVVDLWGGTKHVDGTADTAGANGAEPWRRGTAQVVRSATKGVAAAVPLLLHQRGELDLDAPVGEYWPEFKAHGKEQVRVRHVLNHRAGLPVLDRPLTPEEALDPLRGPEAVAAQAPVWEPGTDHGYHALTYGWLLDELVRRVTGGRSTGEWIAEEIARPLGLDLWLGLPAAEEAAGRAGRVGRVEGPEPSGGPRLRPKRSVTEAYEDPASLTRRAFAAITPFPDQNDPAYRASALPATNGIATADGLARFYAALIGEADGVTGRTRLFDPATTRRARAEESAGPDRVLVVNTRFGLGYMLHGSASPFLSPGSFGHPGRGGSLGFADPEAGLAFGYVTNGFRKTVTADPRAQALVRAVRASLGAG
ncbi:serine hydrolase domain-containing protein [Streptomyces lancefieldiae]|uniref:Serine hydrolase domain-containing protein n=1 Tax=Streptomyces lancefieldiae TaxID=3075520 RepID=A0ABU3AJD2_9ACTN|nr:serine hydrolase domain-containing protein [Streptomyces sp. DSM 40712]MDT0610020.1 serine hydrolase domain-containing protein [Streptomyces sp. DSM 40712]